MSFLTIKYALFLFIAILIYYIFPKKYRWITLLISSYIFYYISSKFLTIFLLISTITIYLAGLFINKINISEKQLSKNIKPEEKKQYKNNIKKQKRLIVLLTIIINFGILGVLKYSGFALNNINHLLSIFNTPPMPIMTFVLPLGISYYTLMALSYVVDVYRGKLKATKNFGKLALYLSFFPQMIEGPISKFDQTAKSLYEGHKFKIDNLIYGISLIILGAFKKLVIADRAGIYVNNIFKTTPHGLPMFLGAILYTLQIYAEFSGCMDIVLGSGKMFGVNLPENFKRPFFSKSIQEFWRRWHITLGAWIKDYIFYPISLSKLNMKTGSFFKKHLPKSLAKFLIVAFPLLFVWLYNGIWHGASFKYIAYGLYYYILIMIGILLAPLLLKIRTKLKINQENIIYKIYEMLRTTLFVVIGMMLFRSHSLMTFIKSFMNLFKKGPINIMDFGLKPFDFIVLIIYIIALIIIGIYQEKGIVIYDKIKKQNIFIKYLIYFVAIISIIILGIYGKGYDTSSFIYGQF